MAVSSSDGDEDGGRGLERIEDPENYNIRRRLKQLHDAKEFVREVKYEADRRLQDRSEKHFNEGARDHWVADAVTDYILELRPMLEQQGKEDEFLGETVAERPSGDVTIATFLDRLYDNDTERMHYGISMQAWDICNSYLEQTAGAVFEGNDLPTEKNFGASKEQ